MEMTDNFRICECFGKYHIERQMVFTEKEEKDIKKNEGCYHLLEPHFNIDNGGWHFVDYSGFTIHLMGQEKMKDFDTLEEAKEMVGFIKRGNVYHSVE